MSDQDVEARSPNKIVIDSDGDVYLELKEAELRVSSKILGIASKVFGTMFRPSFQEGLNLAKNETCRIPLPKDDTVAMHVLCLNLYHQDIPASVVKIDPVLLRNVAILADKYACTYALRYWVEICIGELLALLDDETNHIDRSTAPYTNLLLAAYIFECSSHFTDITKRMVYWTGKENPPNRWVDIDEATQDALPDGLLGKLSEMTLMECQTHFE